MNVVLTPGLFFSLVRGFDPRTIGEKRSATDRALREDSMLSDLLNLGLSPRSPRAIRVGKNAASSFISCQKNAFQLRGKTIKPWELGQAIVDRMVINPESVLEDFRCILGRLFDVEECREGDDFVDLYYAVSALSASEVVHPVQLFERKSVKGVNYCDDLCRMWLASLALTRTCPNRLGRPAYREWFHVGRGRMRVFNRAACCEFTGALRLAQ